MLEASPKHSPLSLCLSLSPEKMKEAITRHHKTTACTSLSTVAIYLPRPSYKSEKEQHLKHPKQFYLQLIHHVWRIYIVLI